MKNDCLETAARASSFTVSSAFARKMWCIVASPENIQAIDEMYHAVVENTVVFHILSHGCGNASAYIALTAQYIEHLQADGSCISFQEILGKLRIPYQFIAVHTAVRISSARVLCDIRRDGNLPWELYVRIHSVGELICIHVVLRLQTVR